MGDTKEEKDAKKPDELAPVDPHRSGPKPNNRQGPGSIGNTVGLVTPKTSPNGSIRDGGPTAATNPPAKPETPQEQSFWSKVSEGVHTGLDALGFVPGLGVVPDLVNAGIYGLEGRPTDALIAAVAAVPGAGDAFKAGTIAAKGGKAIAKEAAEKTAKEAAERAEREAAEGALKEKAEREAAEKAAGERAKRQASESGGAPPRQDGGYSKGRARGPCDHLRKGRGDGPYRGGAHGETRKPKGDERDSHHIPADKVSPLSRDDGPAIQMERTDHRFTASNGSSPESVRYRQLLRSMINEGRWREAMAMEIRDVRQVAREGQDPRKYNQAIREMLNYFKCLDAHGLLK